MQLAILSDIHSNLEALDAILTALPPVDAYLCLGDIVGYGANPNECCERIRAICGKRVVMGNHDAGVVGRLSSDWFNEYACAALQWTRSRLTSENLGFLRGLPDRLEGERWVAVHGSLVEPWEYVVGPWEARASFDALAQPVGFLGHTHHAEYYVQRAGSRQVAQHRWRHQEAVVVDPQCRYLMNPGSVGQPRDRNRKASAAVYDLGAGEVTLLRAEYDVAQAQRKIREAGLPFILAERLASGY